MATLSSSTEHTFASPTSSAITGFLVSRAMLFSIRGEPNTASAGAPQVPQPPTLPAAPAAFPLADWLVGCGLVEFGLKLIPNGLVLDAAGDGLVVQALQPRLAVAKETSGSVH